MIDDAMLLIVTAVLFAPRRTMRPGWAVPYLLWLAIVIGTFEAVKSVFI